MMLFFVNCIYSYSTGKTIIDYFVEIQNLQEQIQIQIQNLQEMLIPWTRSFFSCSFSNNQNLKELFKHLQTLTILVDLSIHEKHLAL
jgi:hypothetical protein